MEWKLIRDSNINFLIKQGSIRLIQIRYVKQYFDGDVDYVPVAAKPNPMPYFSYRNHKSKRV